jgi:hypothetical protein
VNDRSIASPNPVEILALRPGEIRSYREARPCCRTLLAKRQFGPELARVARPGRSCHGPAGIRATSPSREIRFGEPAASAARERRRPHDLGLEGASGPQSGQLAGGVRPLPATEEPDLNAILAEELEFASSAWTLPRARARLLAFGVSNGLTGACWKA